MNLMGCRFIHLQNTLLGYQKTGIPLIEFNGTELVPSFTADDIGIYILIPKIADYFHLSLETAINVFFFGLLLVPCIIGCIGFLFLYKNFWHRFVSVCATLLLTRVAYGIGDVYLACTANAIIIIPWFLYSMNQHKNWTRALFLIFAGCVISFCHYIRAHSGTGILLFMLTYLFFNMPTTWIKKIYLSVSLLFGLSIPYAYFTHCYNLHRHYVQNTMPEKIIGLKNHLFWHSVYIGFGFLNLGNPDNIQYSDGCGSNKVYSINPDPSILYTQEYEDILKNEVFKLIRYHLSFVLNTLFSKLGILLLNLLLFANIGLLCAFYCPVPWQMSVSFLVGLLFNALFPLLVVPIREYSLGFIAFATYFAVISINYTLDQLHRFVKKTTVNPLFSRKLT